MKTPIADFIRDYSASDKMRFHMPGHKGRGKEHFLVVLPTVNIILGAILGATIILLPLVFITAATA